MMKIRNIRFLSILIIVMVWCIPAFASISHMNCTCCTLTKSCCEDAGLNTVQIKKNDTSCPQCKCSISEKSTVKNTYLITTLPVKKNFNLDTYENNTIITPALTETGVITLSHTNPLKFIPLFIKNSTFRL